MSNKDEKATEDVATIPASPSTALTVAEEMQQLFTENAGDGRDDFEGRDFAIPFLAPLQKLSPQVDSTDAKYVEGAEPGMIFNTVSGAFYPALTGIGVKKEGPGIRVVPAAYQKLFVEWVPRDSGGGFVGQHLPDSDVHKSAVADPEQPNKLRLPNGNLLVETAYYYVIVAREEGPEWAVIAMSSTALKVSRKWNNVIAEKTIIVNGQRVKVPNYGQVYTLQTGTEKNDRGSWFGFVVKFAGLVDSPELFSAAKGYRDAVRGGRVRATAAPPTDGPATGEGNQSKDVPF